MADQQPAQTQTQNSAPVFHIQRVYLKEASLEQPNSPAILLEQEQPAVEITLHVAAESLAGHPDIHEVTVAATVTTKVKDKTLFLAECKQAGIFEIRNLPEAQLPPVLNVVCPQIVYPYLRGNVADLIVRGGFPPVHLAEINFQAMYEQQQAQQHQQVQQQEESAALPAAAEQKKKAKG
ncbi:MAG: protein-export chaperone SecB [Burkholderiaceae bacterium]|jgi:preprotein translocase subunit SecB|nr:protein-export chaperone SecB [Burkholderiaceae bacterium]